ncbi:MAG: hypothetical protein KC422_14305 [Trueperaceae bacterium]|nr:hypothetical protein [Trueperaceae bacterium]
MQTYTVKKGILSYLVAVIFFVVSGWLLIGFGIIIFNQFNPTKAVSIGNLIGGLLFTLILGVGSLYVALSNLAQKYVISLEGVYVRRLMKPAFMKWSEVKLIGKAPVLYFHSNYYILPAQGKGLSLFFSMIDRPRHAVKALIEAAYFSKEAINIKFDYVNEFGPPPYGIFLDLPES